MAGEPTTVAELIALWGSAEKFARDINLRHTSHGRLMRIRGRISKKRFDAIVLAASRREIPGITHRVLESINERHEDLSRPFAEQGVAA